ncbi:glycosyltransferase family 2 protein [Lacticaseibacillus daqingensis]|uniref:glycosyltransferase family 2 protein n=1 Tax=Lacticaseibacillus daqingensis TaxID=2486014 RepID=UPI000F7B27A3|nr:glycosyltransferase family A protein [Lacticaseibacillus daqingensis]
MLLSIIVPTYQLGPYFAGMLAALSKQTVTHELWLIDDGSTDGTAELAATYAHQHAATHFHGFAQHRGVSAARNYGLAHATGDALAFVDGDDVIAPTFAATLLAGFTPGVVAVSVGYRWFRALPAHETGWQQLDQAAMFDQVTHHGTAVGGYVWNKAFLRSAIGGLRFDETLSIAEDYWFTASFVAQNAGRYAYWPGLLYEKRNRPNSTIHTAGWQARRTEDAVFARIRQLRLR